MKRFSAQMKPLFGTVLTVIVLVSLLLTLSPAVSVTAATQYLGGYPRADDLRIQILDNGRIGVERYTNGSWDRQIYGTSSKGSRLQWSGGNIGLGYFSGGSPALAYNTSTSSGTAGSRNWTSTAKWTYNNQFEVYQTVTYREGDPYFKLQWRIVNVAGGPFSDLRFFHGEDTYLRLGDNGAGWVDWANGNYTIGVKKNVSGQEQRMALQSVGASLPYAYQSNNYYSIYQAVNSGALTKAIDANESTDNGYAMEWRTGSLGAGAEWTIIAYEKFNNAQVVSGGVQVIAPVAKDCNKGETCSLVYTVKNPYSSAVTPTLSLRTAQSSWPYTVTWPGGTTTPTIGGSSSVNVTVNVTVPSDAANNSSMEVTLVGTTAGGEASETAAVNALTPPNTPPANVRLNGSTNPVSIQENLDPRSVGTLSATDDDPITYSLVGGDTSSFTIVNSELRTSARFNYEAKSSYSVTVRASDGKGGTTDQAFTVNVVNVNEAPTLAAVGVQSVNEDNSLTFTMTATDPDNLTGRLNWSADATSAKGGTVSGAAGTGGSKSITYTPATNFNQTLNNNQPDTFTVRVTGEGGLVSQQTVNVTVVAINDAPLNKWNGGNTFSGPMQVRLAQTVTFDDGSATHVRNRISVSDVEAEVEAKPLVATISVNKGRLELATTAGLTGDTDGTDGSLSITGTVGAINTALEGMKYTSTLTSAGSDTLSITTNDQGVSGQGGSKSDTDTLTINVSNPTTLTIDDGYRGDDQAIQWGYDKFSSIEEALAAARAIDAVTPGTINILVESGSYPADAINLDNAHFAMKLNDNVSLGKDFALSAGSFDANGKTLTFVTGPNNQVSHQVSGTATFANLAAAEGNTIVLAPAADVSLTGALTLPNASALDAIPESGHTTFRLAGTGEQTLYSGLTLDNLVVEAQTQFLAPANLTLQGNLENLGTYGLAPATNSLLTFAGSGDPTQSISGNMPQFDDVHVAENARLQPGVDLAVSGDWNDQGTFLGNGKKVTFNGDVQTFRGKTVFADVVVDATTLTLGSGADFGYSGGVTFNGEGAAFDPTAAGAIVRLAGNGSEQQLPAGVDRYENLIVDSGANLNATARILTVAGDMTVNGDLDNRTGSVSFDDGEAGVSGAHFLHIPEGVTPQFGGLSIALGDTLTPDENREILVGGDWADHNGFVANAGKVTFNGNPAAHAFSGESIFNNVDIVTGSTLTLAAGADFGYTGTVTRSGAFDVLTNPGTTVRITGTTPQSLPLGTDVFQNLVVDPGANLGATGRALTVKGFFENRGSFDNSGGTVTFSGGGEHRLTTAGESGLTQFGSLTIDAADQLTPTCSSGNPIRVKGNWTKTGTISENTCLVIFNGSGAQQINGSGNRFYDLSVENTAKFPNDSTDVDSVESVVVTHTLQVLSGQFQPANGSEFTDVVLGGDESDAQSGILRPDRGQSLSVKGNWDRKKFGWFDANAGTVAFSGDTDQSINGGATFYNLTVAKLAGKVLNSNAPVVVDNLLTTTSGTFSPSSNSKFKNVLVDTGSVLMPAGNINIGGNLTVNGTYTHNNKSVTFDGGPVQQLTGQVSFYNLTVNTGSELEMQPNAVLGYAGALVLNGTLDAITNLPNTIEVTGQNLGAPQTLPEVTVNNLTIYDGSALQLTGALTVTGDMLIKPAGETTAAGQFDPAGNLVTFDKLDSGPQPSFMGAATFGNIAIAADTTLGLKAGASLAFTGDITGGALDGTSDGATTVTVAGTTLQHISTGSKLSDLVFSGSAQLSGEDASLEVYGNWSQGTGTFVPNGELPDSGTVTFKGGAQQTITGSSQVFNHLVIDKTENSVTAGQVTTHGALDLNAGEFKPACGSTFSSVNLAGGTLTLASAPCEITVNGNWTHSSGTFVPNGGVVFFDAEPGVEHVITGAAATLDGLRLGADDTASLASGTNLRLAGPLTLDGTGNLGGADDSTLTVTGRVESAQDMQLDNLVIETSGALVVPHALTITGDLQNNVAANPAGCPGAESVPAECHGLFNGGGSVTFTQPDGVATAVEHSVATVTDTPGNFDGATYFGSLTIAADNTVNQAGSMHVAGNWQNNGTYAPVVNLDPETQVDANGPAVIFNGTTNQTIQTTNGSGNNFYNLTIDNLGTNPNDLVSSGNGTHDAGQPALHVAHDLNILHGRLLVPDDSTLVNVHIAPGGTIDLPAPGADISVIIDGHWDNQGQITTGGATSITQGEHFYLESAVVSKDFQNGVTPGFGFDKFDLIGSAIVAAKDDVYVIGGADAIPVNYTETIAQDGANVDLGLRTTAEIHMHGNVGLTSIDVKSGALSLDAGSILNLTSFAQEGGTVQVGSGSLILNGNFAPTGGAFQLDSGRVVTSGDFTPTAGVFNTGTGLVILNGSGAQAILAGTTFANLTIQNTADPSAASVTVSPDGETKQITVTGDLTLTSGQFMPDTGSHFKKIYIDDNAILKLVSGAQVTVDQPGGSLELTGAGNGQLLLNGGKILGIPQSTVTVDAAYTTATSGFGYNRFKDLPTAFNEVSSVLGTVIVHSGSYTGAALDKTNVTVSIENGQTVTIVDTATHTDESLTITNGSLQLSGNGTLEVAGDLDLTSGHLVARGSSGDPAQPWTDTVKMNGASNQAIKGAGLQFANLTIANTGTDTVVTTEAIIDANGDLNVADGIFEPACGSKFNNVTVASGAVLRLPAAAEGQTCSIFVSGNWQVADALGFIPNGATVVFNGSDSHITGAAGFASVQIADGAKLTGPAGTLSLTGDWDNQGTFDPNGGTISFTGTVPQALSGNLNFHHIDIADTSTVTPANDLSLTGNWTQAGADDFVPGTHAVSFIGSANQTISGPAEGVTFYDLVFDPVYTLPADPVVVLTVNPQLTVTHLLDMVDGNFTLGHDSYVQNPTTHDAKARLGENATLTLGGYKLYTDVWDSLGGTVTMNAGGGLVPASVNVMEVDDDFSVANNTPGYGIDKFNTITEALSQTYLAENAIIYVNAGSYPEDVVIEKNVQVIARGSITINNLTLNAAGAVFKAPVAEGSNALTVTTPKVSTGMTMDLLNGAFQAGSGTTTITGPLNVGATGTFSAGSGTLNLDGNLTVAAGGAFDAGTGTLNMAGSERSISDGLTLNTLNAVTGGSLTLPATLTLTGSLNGAGAIDGGTTTLTLDGAADGAEHTLAGAFSLNNVSVTAGDTLNLAPAATWTLAGELNLGEGAQFVAQAPSAKLVLAGSAQTLQDGLTLGSLEIGATTTFTAQPNLTLTGNLALAAETSEFVAGTGTVTMAGSGEQLISGAPISFYNLVIDDADNDAGANDTRANVVVDVVNRLDIADGKFSPAECGQYGDVVIGAAGEFIPPAEADCAILVSGNWTNNGTFTKGTSKVTFNNIADNVVTHGAQTISGSQQTDFYNLEIANTTDGAVSATSLNSLKVSGLLTVTDGTLEPGANAQLTNVNIASDGLFSAPAGSISVAGDWTNAGGFQANNGTVAFTGSGTHDLGGVTAFDTVSVADGNTMNLAASATATINRALNLNTSGEVTGAASSTLFLDVSGPVTLPTGTTLGGLKIGAQANFDAPASLTLGGDLTSLGVFNAGEGSVTFNGATPKKITGNYTFYDLVGSSNTGTISLAENAQVMIKHDFSIPAQGETVLFDGSAADTTLILSTGTMSILPSYIKVNDLVIEEGTSVYPGVSSTIYGDLQVDGSIDDFGHNLFFTGPDNTIHNLTGSGSVQLGQVTIDTNNTLKPAQGKEITITGSFTQDGTFDPNDGTVVFSDSVLMGISGANSPVHFNNLIVRRYDGESAAANPLAGFVAIDVAGQLDVEAGSFYLHDGSSIQDVLIEPNGNLAWTTGTVSVGGDWTDQRAVGQTTGAGGTLAFTKAGEQTFSGKTRFDTIAVNAGSTLVLAQDADLGYAAGMTLNGQLDATRNTGTVLTVTGDSNAPHPTVPNGLTLRTLTVSPAAATLDGQDHTVTLLGDLNVDGTIIPNLNVIFGGSGAQKITGSGSVGFGDLTIGEQSNLSLDPTNRTITVYDDWNDLNPAGGFTPGTGMVIFDGEGDLDDGDPAAHMISGVVTPIFYDLTIEGAATAGQVTVSNNLAVGDGGNFQPSNGSDFNNVTIHSNGILQPETGATIKVGGNWTDNGAWSDTPADARGFIPNGGTVVFDGAGDQSIGGTRSPIRFDNLVISDSGTVTPAAPLNVTGDLRLEENGGKLMVPTGSVLENVAINPGATFELIPTTAPDPAPTFTLNGSWSNQGTYITNGGGLAAGSHPQLANVTVDPDTCTATPSVCGVDIFSTIQAAIDAVASDGVVTVLPATYAEATVTLPAAEVKPVRLVFQGTSSDTFTLTGDLVQNGGTIIAPQGTLNLGGSYTHSAGAFNPNDGTVVFNGADAHSLTGVETNFNNLVIDLSDSDTQVADVLGASAPVNVASTLEIIHGTFAPEQCGQYGNVIIHDTGAFAPQNAGACVKVSGNWTNDGAFAAPEGQTVTFNGTGTQTIGGTQDTTFSNLALDNPTIPAVEGNPAVPGTVNLADGRKLTVEGMLTVVDQTFQPRDGSTFGSISIGEAGTLSPTPKSTEPLEGATINLLGNFDNQGTFTHNNSTLNLTGGADQALDGTLSFYNLTINKEPSTATVDANDSLAVANQLELTSGILQFSGADLNQVHVDTNGSLLPDTGATFSISGNWDNDGAYTPNQDTLILDGNGAQNVSGVPHLYNLTVNNTATPDPACTTTETCNTFYDANSVSFTQPLTVDNQTTVHDGQYRILGGSSFNNLSIDSAGRARGQVNGEINTLAVTGTLTNRGVLDLNGLNAGGNFTLDTIYISSEYGESTPGYGVDHFTSINAALGLTGLGDNATLYIYGGDYSGDVVIDEALNVEMKSVSALDENQSKIVNLAGSLTLNHADATLKAPQGELNLTGNLTVTAGSFDSNHGLVHFAGSEAQTINGALTFSNLKITNTQGTAEGAGVKASDALTVTGELTVAEGRFAPMPCSSFASVRIEAGGLLEPQAITAPACSSGLTVNGNWTNAGGTFTPNGSTVTFNGDGAQSISGETGFDQLVIDNSGDPGTVTATGAFNANTLTINAGTLILPDQAVVGDVVIGEGANLALAPGATLTVTGDWLDENPNGGFTANAGTVRFDNDDPDDIQTVTGNSTFHNLEVAGDTHFMLDDGSSLGYSGSFTVETGGTIDLTGTTPDGETTLRVVHTDDSPAPQRLPGPGDLTLDNLVIGSGATLNGDTAGGAGQNLTLLGDLTNNGTFQGGTGQVTFGGTGEQDITGSGSTTFHDIVIGPDSTLNGPDGTLGVTGNWTNNGTYDPGAGTVAFSGPDDQTIIGETDFNNLVINKDTNAGQVTVGNDSDQIDDVLNVTGTLNVQTGQFIQVQSGSTFDTIQIGSNGTFVAENGATDISANHLDINGSFQTPDGVFNPSNVLWKDGESTKSTTSVAEKPVGQKVGELTTIDLNLHDQNLFTYTLKDGAAPCDVNDNALFRLEKDAGSGLTSVWTNQPLDFETHLTPSYKVCIETKDPTDRTTIKPVWVTPTDANDEPVVTIVVASDPTRTDGTTFLNVDEDTNLDFTLEGSDQDRDGQGQQRDTITWQITDWPDHGTLTAPISGEQTMTGNQMALNYRPSVEGWNGDDSFSIRLTDNYSGMPATVTQVIPIKVVAINDPPVNVSVPVLSTQDDQPKIGQKVQSTSGEWNDNNELEPGSAIRVTYQWQRANEEDGVKVNVTPIDGATGSAYTPTAADQGQWIRVLVTAHDSGWGTPASAETTAESAWMYIPGQQPTNILLTHSTVAENQPAGTAVGTLQAIDPDQGDTFTYALVDTEHYPNNDLFTIVGSSLRTTQVFHYAADAEPYQISVQATDGGGNTYVNSFNISVVGLQTGLQPKQETNISYPATEQNPITTDIHVPYGGVLDEMTLVYVPRSTVPAVPQGQAFTNQAFDLSAFLNGEETKDYEFNKPFTVTLTYSDSVVAGMYESSLNLQTWNGSSWEESSCGTPTLDTQANTITLPVCKLGQFALFGTQQQGIFMPLMFR